MPVSDVPRTWRQLRWSLPFLAALLPIILLSFFSYQVASQSVRDQVESENMYAANNISQLVIQDISRIATIAHAVASVPGSLDAVRKKDDLAMRERLRAVVLAYPQIDRVFLTDPDGLLWTDYPQSLDAFGKSQADADWYQGVSDRWKPYISNVYLRSHDPTSAVIAIATPVIDNTQEVIGALVFEYKTEQIRRWLGGIQIGDSGHLFIVDQKGVTVAHPDVSPAMSVDTTFANVGPIMRARDGSNFLTEEYDDPLVQRRMIASFQPLSIGTNTWVVVAEQPIDEAFAVLNNVRRNISLAGGVLTLITIGMVVALGITARRNERLNSALAEKNQTLQDITSFVSHQLRAPVTAMRWTIEGMMDGDNGPVGEDLKKALIDLQNVAIQNGKLIDDILNVSRIDRGVIEVQTEPVSLKDIAERALRDYRVALEKAGLSLTLEGVDKPIMVQADKEKMAESVTNAISNAIKHTKQGGITLKLRSDSSYGYIDVIDTGEGMPPEVVQNLFSRTGIKGKNTDSSKSTGLGLFIARNFMRLQNGDIEVSAVLGKGSTFSYKIPLAAATTAK